MITKNYLATTWKIITSNNVKILSYLIIALSLLSCTSEEDAKESLNVYDGEYSGFLYLDNEELGSWKIIIENGMITPVPTSDNDDIAINGQVDREGNFTGSTEEGYILSGDISGEQVNGIWEAGSYSGTFTGFITSSTTGNENGEDEDNEDEEGEEEEEEEEEEEIDYSELDADFSMVIEGPLGTTGGYWDDPVSVEFSTSNDHFQNYNPAPKFSWSYYVDYRNEPDEDLEHLSDEYFTDLSDQATYSGHSFTKEVQLKPIFDTTYVYFRLAITRPDGEVVVKTKKKAFPMIRSSGYFKVNGKTYSLDPEDMGDTWPNDRITFKNIDNRMGPIPYFSAIHIPDAEETVGDNLYVDISTSLPAGQLLSFNQMSDSDICNEGCYQKLGFYVHYGTYTTFDDPSGAYSSGSLNVIQGNEHPEIQNSIELKMTLRGQYGLDEEDEITAELVLFNVTAEDYD